MKKIKKVTLCGLGAIGAFFADRLREDSDIVFNVLAGGERADRLREKGLIINGRQKYFNIVSPEEKTSFSDLIIISTKFSGLKSALEDIKNQVGPDTLIMAPLNGVESEDAVASVYGFERTIYSLVRVSSVKNSNKVSFDPETSFVEFGERINDPSNPSENVSAIKALFDHAKIKSVIQPDMQKAIWEKFVCNVSENQVSAVLDIPFGAWGSSKSADQLRLMVADEVISVAEKKGISIDRDYPRRHLEFLKKVPVENKSSTLQDILAGRKTEKDIFSGAMIRLGRETGVPTPLNEFLYHALTVLEEKNDGKIMGI